MVLPRSPTNQKAILANQQATRARGIGRPPSRLSRFGETDFAFGKPRLPRRSSPEGERSLVRPAGFEPAAFGSGGQRSIQLSYGRMGTDAVIQNSKGKMQKR